MASILQESWSMRFFGWEVLEKSAIVTVEVVVKQLEKTSNNEK